MLRRHGSVYETIARSTELSRVCPVDHVELNTEDPYTSTVEEV